MPEFFHDRADAQALFDTLAAERRLPAAVVEKDYWVMHGLWGLQQCGLKFEMKGGTSLSKGWGIIDRFSEDIDIRFESPAKLNIKGDKPAHIKARKEFFDDLATRIKIPGCAVERNRAYDDEKAQNGGISLKYTTHFPVLPDLKPEVLLEVGFARTVPNEPRDITSWVLDKALAAGLEVADNRAPGVKCFNPEFTFVDKLQTICKRFRQYRDRRDPRRDRPREFLRHYYDLYKLLRIERVLTFVKTNGYADYKAEKLRGADAAEFESREALTITNAETYALFEREYAALNSLLLAPGPTFKEVMERIREQAKTL